MTREERARAQLLALPDRAFHSTEEIVSAMLAFADAEAAAMREALKFYADRDSYYCGMGDVCISDYPVMDDGGDIARRALAK